MRVLQVHNYYKNPGGEDNVCHAERDMLASRGHEVRLFSRTNRFINGNGSGLVRLAATAVWSNGAHDSLLSLLRKEKPDIVHFHNTFPLISPSAYYACREAGTPVVQSLHNYRLLCPAATFYRGGSVCEDCCESSLWQSLRHSCYRDSLPATAVSAAMLAFHRLRGTWIHMVDKFIALSEFSRAKFIAQGWPAQKLMVKPNFVNHDPGPRRGAGEYALFVGRLAQEKGILTLLRAWQLLPRAVPLRVAGDGPLREDAEQLANGAVSFLGQLDREAVFREISNARFLIFPSEWYECFPMTIAEAYACGVPVIASKIGAMQEIVEDGRLGLHFATGDPVELAAKIKWAWDHPGEMAEMGRAARIEYQSHYTAEQNYASLMEIYRAARGT